ncbi:hypothetical protein EON64_08830 [archaeon]|nr:MAG: hypothetical protein EON64_08830 [archaeon]
MRCGGFGEARDATDEDQSVLEHVKQEIQNRLGRSYSNIRAVKVTTQVVAGVNYLMKLQCDSDFVHAKIAKPLPHTGQNPFLLALADGHSADSALEYIE